MKQGIIIILVACLSGGLGCSSKWLRHVSTPHLSVVRIEPPLHNLGYRKTLALVDIVGPWQAQSYLSSQVIQGGLNRGYLKFMDFKKSHVAVSPKEIRIYINTEDKKEDPLKNLDVDYLLFIDVLEWEKSEQQGVDEEMVREFDRDAWKTIEKKVLKPWTHFTYTVAVHFQIVDVKTRTFLFSNEFTESAEEKVYLDQKSSQYKPRHSFKELSEQVSGGFLNQINPFYINVDLFFDNENKDNLDAEALQFIRNLQYHRAVQHWLDTIQKYPKRSESYHNLAVVYHGQGKFDEAKNYFQKAIQLQRKDLYQENLEELLRTITAHHAIQTKTPIRILPQ